MHSEQSVIRTGTCCWYNVDVVWCRAPECYVIPEGHVHVWRFPLEVADVTTAMSLLSTEEHTRWCAMGDSRRRQTYLASRAMLRRLAGLYLAVSPSEIVLASSRRNGISIASPQWNPPLCVSLSHSGGTGVVALAGMEIGIDMEQLRAPARYPRILQRMFPESWCEDLYRLEHAPEAQARLFTRYWTALESLYKLHGVGLLRNIVSHEADGGDRKCWGSSFVVIDTAIASLSAQSACKISGYDAGVPGSR